MPKTVFLLLVVAFFPFLLFAQELNCKVLINADQVQTTERSIFKDMETSFSQFMSTRKWTNDVMLPEERINCNINITLDKNPDTNIGSFSASVHIRSARPIYNTNYESIIFNFVDREWEFEYTQSQPLEFNENSYQNNLTSLLAYYAYIIIGLDYDSFGDMDGTPYFQKAQNIVNNALQSNRSGWDSFGNTRNRYWLVENLINQQMASVRKGLYSYHRLALDKFDQDPDDARTKILESLKEIKKVKDRYPNSILIISFMDAKNSELVKVFSDGNLSVRREAFDVLSNLDPTQTDKFKEILK